MRVGSAEGYDSPGRGLAFATASYGLFSLQDATVKWLVQDYSVFQILFARSLVVFLIAVAVGRREALADLRRSRRKVGIAARTALVLLAWILFFTASRQLGLAELTTLYFAAPVITVVLSVLILKEAVSVGRWCAVLVGFAGVAVAARPGNGVAPLPALLTIGAAAVWALSGVLGRLISRTEGTLSQMIAGNALFTLACSPMLPALWRMPTLHDLGLMMLLGLVGGAGQVFMYEGYRLAPASLVAPTEYTAFLWAFLLGFAIWGDLPSHAVWAGAALILCAGVLLLGSERSRVRREPRPASNGAT